MKNRSHGLWVASLVLGTVIASIVYLFPRREKRENSPMDQLIDKRLMARSDHRRFKREQKIFETYRQKAWSDGVITPWEAFTLIRKQHQARIHPWPAEYIHLND